MTTLNARSIANLAGVHADLRNVVMQAAATSTQGFIVTEGLRTQARQAQLFKAGATKTMNSRHLTGHAVDLAALVAGSVRWDWPLYAKLAASMKAAALSAGVPITWGGDWRTFKDGPHFELPWASYP